MSGLQLRFEAWLPRWLGWLEGRIVERRDATSCAGFVVGVWPLLLVLWCLQCAPVLSDTVAAHYRPGWAERALWALSLLMAWLAWMGWLGWRRRHDASPQPWLVQLTVMPGSLGLLWLVMGHGFKDNPSPMLLLYVVVVSRALFVPRALRWAWGLSVVCIAVAEALAHAAVWPDAPLLVQPMFTGQALAPWWAVWVRVVFLTGVLPLSGVLFVLAIALERRRRELESLARTDALTGLSNRREFMAQLERESRRHVRSGQALSLVLCDVDHFKRINDSWGHPVGDQVLARMGALLRQHTREQVDTAARYGGEEFVLLLPDTDLAGAQRVAEKLSERLRTESFEAQGQRFSVTQSVGVAEVVQGDAVWALRVADRNLYQAKQAGRDRMVASVAFAEDAASGSNTERRLRP